MQFSLQRRQFLQQCGLGLGAMAFGGLPAFAGDQRNIITHPARAKAVIYLHLSGGPSSLDLFDYKPLLNDMHMKPCPDSLFAGKRFAFIKGTPKLLGSPFKFERVGKRGTWMSELLPFTKKIVDDIAIVRSMTTDQINHAPAEMFLHTGSMFAGSASIGSWVNYAIGSKNKDLPGFIVMLSGGTDPTGGKSLWSSGILPGEYQGVQCRGAGEPILFSQNPDGIDAKTRLRTINAITRLNDLTLEQYADPETQTRSAQYDLSYRMQSSVPSVFNIAGEDKKTLELYGAKPGEASFANNCLQARRLVENGVRYIQLFDWGWDSHGTGPNDDLPHSLVQKCKEFDQAYAALITDLKQRGMLDDTLVICGGEFGRTPMNEARGGSKSLGRDHHPECFSMLYAGGGFKPGIDYGVTDEFGYNITENPVTLRDLQASILYLLGIDPFRLGKDHQGLFERLIGPTNDAKIMTELFA